MRVLIRQRKAMAVCFVVMLGVCINTQAQTVSRKPLGDRNKAYFDSLRKMNYNYVLPAWGKRVYKKGFDIPYPLGIMVNYFYGKQNILISNMSIGISTPDKTLPPVNVDNFVKFKSVQAIAQNVNIRADAYVLPFLNVYGMFNYFPKAKTEVELSAPVSLTSSATQSGYAYGFGVMGAGGFGPVWVQADFNVTWAKMELLSNKVFTTIMGFRMGHTFPLGNNPQQNIAVWIGTMGLSVNAETKGEVYLKDVLPDVPQSKIDEIKQSYGNWYNNQPAVKKAVVDRIMQALQDRVNGNNIDDVKIIYEMDKRPEQKWAGLVGVQYQMNKRWQLRTEANIVGNRSSIMASINYRFLGFKRKQKGT
ncbi:MAG: hypothetical protein J0I41_20940 [Filimonas sp.]|nr:hypothetical protein [Filimonas sp.]